MIYAKYMGNDQKIWMAKSADSINWVEHKMIINSKHDSQYSVEILPNGDYLIFVRMWNKSHTDRQIGTSIVTSNGEVLQYPTYLGRGGYYNAPSFKVADDIYVLFPTYYNSSSEYIDIQICFYLNGKFGNIGQSISESLFKDEIIGFKTKWAIISPGLTLTGEKDTFWLYYFVNNQTHNYQGHRKTKYCRAQIKIKPIEKEENIVRLQ